MHRLSGEFLSRLVHALEQAAAGPRDAASVLALLQPLCESDNLFVDLPPASKDTTRSPPGARVVTGAALDRLNALLPWCTLAATGGAGVQGTLWSSGKPPPARLVNPVKAASSITGKSSLIGMNVLDLGCFEGLHAIGFARQGARVWAVDGRIENVVKTLVRVWLAGLEQQVSVQWVDLEQGPLATQLAWRGLPDAFDLVHHSQLLNHLSDPVHHLRECAVMCRGQLYLNTLVETCSDAEAAATIELDGQRFAVGRHREASAPWAPFGGTVAQSSWLTQESLLRLLAHLGLQDIDVRQSQDGRNGHRLALMASRPAIPQPEPAPRREWPERFCKVLVVGLGRSGTSAVASLLKACGFFMGDDLDPVLHESTGLRSLLKQRRHAEIDVTLRAWQAAHPRIAWKDPKLHSEGATYIDTLDDDWLVFAVFRDPVAVAQRRAVADGVAFDAAFEHTLASESGLRDFVRGSRKRVVPVSYERLMAAPQQTIGELLSYLDLGPSAPPIEAIWAYMQERRLQYRNEQTVQAAADQAAPWRSSLAPEPQGG